MARLLLILLLALAPLLWLTPQVRAQATTHEVTTQCPICVAPFKNNLPTAVAAFGQRLDLRRTGPISTPWELPQCPQCHLVVFKDPKTFTAQDLKTLKPLLESEQYKAIPKDAQSYHRLALMFEALKRPENTLGFVWLQASWQVESDAKLCRQFLTRSLEHYEKYLTNLPKLPDNASDEEKTNAKAERMTALFLKAEILRRLERFKDASKHLKTFENSEEFKNTLPFPLLIHLERTYIDQENAEPQEVQLPR